MQGTTKAFKLRHFFELISLFLFITCTFFCPFFDLFFLHLYNCFVGREAGEIKVSLYCVIL